MYVYCLFFVLREIMFHVSTLLPFSNGDSQQVIMDVTGPSLRNGVRDLTRYYKRDPPDTFMQVSDWGKTKNISIYLPPSPHHPLKWPKPQFNKISKFQFVKCWLKNKISSATWKRSCSSCLEEKSPMVPNPDPKQYYNNWKNDMSLFSATNQERPYEQLLHNCLKVLPNRFNFDDDTKGFCPRFKSQNYKTWSFTPTERAERVLTCQIGCITTNSRLNRKYPV